MTIILKQLFSFIKLLNSDHGTNQIASGIAVGFVLGMTPFFSLQSILLFILMFVFRIQIGAVFVSAFFFAFIAYMLDSVFHLAGTWILEKESLTPLFTTLYNMPIIPFTRFNNTIVMGSGAVSLLLTPIIFIFAKYSVDKYRVTVLASFKNSKLYLAFKATSIYKWYITYEELYGHK